MRVTTLLLLMVFLSNCFSDRNRDYVKRKGNQELLKEFKLLADQARTDSIVVFHLDSLTTFDWDTVLVVTPYTPIDYLEKEVALDLEPLKSTRITVTEGVADLAFVKDQKLVDFLELSAVFGLFDSFEGTRFYTPSNSTFRMYRSGRIFSDGTEILRVEPLDTTMSLILWQNSRPFNSH